MACRLLHPHLRKAWSTWAIASHRGLARRLTTSATEASAVAPPSRGIGVYFFMGLTGLTTGLGVWQLVRYDWKKRLIEGRTAELSAPPVVISAGEAADAIVRQRPADAVSRVLVRGTFDAKRTVRIAPRAAPADTPAYLSSLSSANAGYSVVTPLTRLDGSTVLVLRGWSPSDAPAPAPPSGPVEVVGVVRGSEAGNAFSVRSVASGPDGLPVLSVLDVAKVCTAAGISGSATGSGGAAAATTAAAAQPASLPLLVESVSPFPDRASVRALTSEGKTPWPITRQMEELSGTTLKASTHLIYAGTWFTLAACGAAITARRFGMLSRLFGGSGKRAGRNVRGTA